MRKLEAALFGVGAAVIVAGVIAYFRPDPPPAEQQIGAGKEIQKIFTPVYQKARVEHTRDTIRLTQWRTRYDTVRVEERITDTVWVREFVRVSDSTIRACTSAVGSCGRVRAALEELNRGLSLELVGTRRQRDEEHARYRRAERGKVIVGVASFATGYLAHELISGARKPP